MIERRNATALAQPVGPYVHAVAHQGVLYASGLTAFGTAAQSGSLPAQAEAIMEQLSALAAECGTALSNLLKVTIFVTATDNLPALREVLARYYGAHPPASSLVRVAGLFAPELAIEIEAILALDA